MLAGFHMHDRRFPAAIPQRVSDEVLKDLLYVNAGCPHSRQLAGNDLRIELGDGFGEIGEHGRQGRV